MSSADFGLAWSNADPLEVLGLVGALLAMFVALVTLRRNVRERRLAEDDLQREIFGTNVRLQAFRAFAALAAIALTTLQCLSPTPSPDWVRTTTRLLIDVLVFSLPVLGVMLEAGNRRVDRMRRRRA